MSRAMMQALKTPGLTATERTIFAYLVGRSNGAKVCWERITNIQADLGIKTRHTVCDTTKKLVAMGRLHVKRRLRMENCYTILDPDGWLYDPPGGKSNGASYEQNTAHLTDLSKQNTAHLVPSDVQKTTHPDVQKTTQESFSKNEERKEGREGERPRSPPTLVVIDWKPSDETLAVGSACGFLPWEIDDAADRMRDHYRATGKAPVDWDARFRNWLRENVARERAQPKRRQTVADMQRDMGLPSFAMPVLDDDDGSTVRMLQ